MQAGDAGTNANMNNMQCMFMMVPANWNQSPSTPPGSFKGAGNQVNFAGRGGKGGAYSNMQMIGMNMPNSMDMNQQQAQAWRAMMPQYNMGLMPDAYPQGYQASQQLQ